MNDINAVLKAQEYISTHHSENGFRIEAVCNAVGYSRRQLDRFFQKHVKTTLHEYVNAVILTESAKKLLNTNDSVIDVAFDSHYHSHEGYTRSFTKRFSVTPQEYRKHPIAIPLFTQHPANHYHILKEGRPMETTAICTVTPIDRPQRKLIYLTSKAATDYLSFCEEVGCDWEGLLNSIQEKFDTAALIELPDSLRKNGISKIAAGVEVPISYEKPLPEGYQAAMLPECVMLYFQSEPYDNADNFGAYIGQVFQAIEKYDFPRYGYQQAKDLAPTFNFGAEPDTGARAAVPVKRVK